MKEAQTLVRHATPQMTLGVYGRTREERLHHVVEQVAAVLQGETQRVASVHRMGATEKTKAVNDQGRVVYSSVHPMEAAGIEPASESLQLQPLHMLFRGRNGTPPNLPGLARRVFAWFKFRRRLLQAWENGGYPTS